MTTLLFSLLLAAAAPDPRALAALDTAIARMGGADALRGVQRVRYDMMTQWMRTTFDAEPFADMPSYERHVDVRDYTLRAWRNTRYFPPPPAAGPSWRYITDIVRDGAAIRDMGNGFAPLNIAYVDEQKELFAFSPERVVLLARDAQDLELLRDTTIAGRAYTRVRGTIGGLHGTLFLRTSDGLPARFDFTAAQPNDFGLVPWGEMPVEIWYSVWRTFPEKITIPTQWDVRRVGATYKRMTVLGATFNPVATPDSFAISDALRAEFKAKATRPMHDLALDSARVTNAAFVEFRTFGAPAGAVRLGNQWLLLETGQAELSFTRAAEWLRAREPSTRIGAAVITSVFPGNGGVVAAARERLPVHVAPGGAPIIQRILRNHGADPGAVKVAQTPQKLIVGTDTIQLAPVDLPNARGALLVYVPRLRYMYGGMISGPLDTRLALAAARRLGWEVESLGTARTLVAPVQ